MLFRNVGKELGNNPGDVGKLKPCVFSLFFVVIACHQKAVHLQLHGARGITSIQYHSIWFNWKMFTQKYRLTCHFIIFYPSKCPHPAFFLWVPQNVPNPPIRCTSEVEMPSISQMKPPSFLVEFLWGNAPRHWMIFGDEKKNIENIKKEGETCDPHLTQPPKKYCKSEYAQMSESPKKKREGTRTALCQSSFKHVSIIHWSLRAPRSCAKALFFTSCEAKQCQLKLLGTVPSNLELLIVM